MNIRIAINIVLSAVALLAAVGLMLHGPLFVRSLSAPDRGLLFAGAAHVLLIVGLLGFSAFAGAVARAWRRGDIPLPPRGTIRPDMAYRGTIMVRYWYFLLPALLGLLGAILLAQRTTVARARAVALQHFAPTAACAMVRARPDRSHA